MTPGHALFWLVVVQRLFELAYARRNTRILKQQGGIESGRGHYPVVVLLHISWLVAVWLGIRRDPGVRWIPLAVFLLLQVMRIWVMASLGRFWTTRVISIAGEPLVRRGPYRYVAHPNYLVVIGEIAVLPLVFGQVANAAIFSLLNFIVLAWRIRVENAALEPRRAPRSDLF
jgi:methyltransferase